MVVSGVRGVFAAKGAFGVLGGFDPSGLLWCLGRLSHAKRPGYGNEFNGNRALVSRSVGLRIIIHFHGLGALSASLTGLDTEGSDRRFALMGGNGLLSVFEIVTGGPVFARIFILRGP